MSPLDRVLGCLEGVKKAAGGSFVARCPAHEDRQASLSVAEGEDGRVLLKCFAGCETADICAAMSLELADLFPPKESGNGKHEIVATYDYLDERGDLLYQVVRFSPKDFRQRKPDGNGGWVWKLGDARRVLYHLPQVLDAVKRGEPVYVCEGEKDVHAVEQAGSCATCNPGGAGKWRPEYSDSLTGASVVVVADKDEPGRKHAADVAASLKGKAASVSLVEAVEGKDVSDHLRSGHGLGALANVKSQDEPEQPNTLPLFVDWPTFWAEDDEEQEWVWKNVLARGRGHAIYAVHKGGKSLLALYAAAEMATSSAGISCVYLDYEMTANDVRERLRDMNYGPTSDLSHLHYALLPTLPPLDTPEGGEKLDTLIGMVADAAPERHIVVVIDTISRAVWGEENSADTWRLFYIHTGLRLKQRGATWLRLDHGGKDAERGQRGSSGKGDDVDVVWKLSPTENGVLLRRELARMSWVPETVTLLRQDYPLAYLPTAEDWPEGTGALANIMNRLELPLNVSERVAGKRLREIDEGRRHDFITAAIRYRRWLAASGNGPGNTRERLGEQHGERTPKTQNLGSGTHAGTPGNSATVAGEQALPLLRGGLSPTQPDDDIPF